MQNAVTLNRPGLIVPAHTREGSAAPHAGISSRFEAFSAAPEIVVSPVGVRASPITELRPGASLAAGGLDQPVGLAAPARKIGLKLLLRFGP